MGLFSKFKAGLQKTHGRLAHEIKRIVTRSPKLDAASLEELEAALIAADLGVAMTGQIVAAVKHAYETQGGAGLDVFAIARAEVEKSRSFLIQVSLKTCTLNMSYEVPCLSVTSRCTGCSPCQNVFRRVSLRLAVS